MWCDNDGITNTLMIRGHVRNAVQIEFNVNPQSRFVFSTCLWISIASSTLLFLCICANSHYSLRRSTDCILLSTCYDKLIKILKLKFSSQSKQCRKQVFTCLVTLICLTLLLAYILLGTHQSHRLLFAERVGVKRLATPLKGFGLISPTLNLPTLISPTK